jgi:hypothetical protein
MSSGYKIARMPDDKRISLLLAFAKTFQTIALDDALDVLDSLLVGISGNAKKIGQKNRLRTLKDLDKSALALAEVCTLILNEETNNDQLRNVIYAQFSRKKLEESIAIINDLARPPEDKFHDELLEQYGRVSRFIYRLLHDITFEAAPAGKNILAAINYLVNLGSSRKQILDNPPLDIVTKPWRRIVFNKDGEVTRRGYMLCFLDRLQDGLRRRDVYVEKSDRWGDPRTKLLQGDDWQNNRVQICRLLGHSITPQETINNLTQQLDATYKKVASNFEGNASIRMDYSGKYPSLTITNLDKLEISPSYTLLNKQVTELVPQVDLTEVILEIHALTGFADEFTHVSESNARADDLSISICAILLAEACNIGLEPLIKHHIPALTRHRLTWVKQNYLRAETLVRANARLVDYQSTIPLAKKWGGGEVASAE